MKQLFFFLSIGFFSNQLVAQNASKLYWQQQVNYNISVSLNDKDHSIDALEKIVYTNNSPDTLKFIWFHIWQNAYKNDKTAFSEQLLVNGRTDFYFSDDKDKGYTNKLAFKVDDINAKIEAHSQHIDIVKLLLPKPLPPKQSIVIETPFHSKLPYNFSRGGHIENDYQLTQWYPKPAVYDAKGWHEMPYLDQGEFYSEFGSFEVNITVPDDYLVAATGELQTATELTLLKKLGKIKFTEQPNYLIDDEVEIKKSLFPSKLPSKSKTVTAKKIKSTGTKTLIYKQDNIHDFAWFASKNFLVQYDTLKLDSKVVDCFSFFPKSKAEKCFDGNMNAIKNALKRYSNWIGEYPYNTATVVVGKQLKTDGMEYPTITYINTEQFTVCFPPLISHELGHNWFYGILASNEREHPWMDEGMNSYYDERWSDKSPRKISHKNSQGKKEFIVDTTTMDTDFDALNYTLKGIQKGMPTDTNSMTFPKLYYGLIVYEKAAYWMKQLEVQLGKNVFDSVMKKYYQQWQFKHPYPQDFKKIVEKISGKNIDALYAKLFNNEPFHQIENKKVKLSLSFPIPKQNVNKYNYVSVIPMPSYNFYDGIRLGIALHNYQVPLPKFQFIVNPSYGSTSGLFNFFGRASYNIYKRKSWLELSTSFQKYTYNNFTSDAGDKFNLGITRFVPSIKYTLYNNDLRSTERTVIGFKTFYLNQDNLLFGDNNVITTPSTKSYINRLYFTKFDNRVLYPYNINLTIDQGEDFVRAAFTAKQFFNYGKQKGGIEARFFAGKFFYLNGKTILKQYYNDQYHLNLSGPKGYEDYTYSDYFIGRGEFEGWRNQQIMERDGFFKVRTDLLGSKVGKTDDWLMALNLNADCPNFPTLKLFADIGTYAEAWNDNPATGKFLFDAGIQLSLLKNTVNIYAPILSSKVFRDYNKSILTDKIFAKSISFSINLQSLHFNKLSTDIPL